GCVQKREDPSHPADRLVALVDSKQRLIDLRRRRPLQKPGIKLFGPVCLAGLGTSLAQVELESYVLGVLLSESLQSGNDLLLAMELLENCSQELVALDPPRLCPKIGVESLQCLD